MIFPLVLLQVGIFQDYWGDFTRNTWAVHVHYWVASAWYVLLIVQPYLYAKGSIATHRTVGIFGFFIAGGFGFTSISMMHRDIVYADAAAQMPERFGALEPWFFLGVLVNELALFAAFMIAVPMAILQRKRMEDHAWWLLSTAFIIMMPALGRGIQNTAIMIYGIDNPIIALQPLYLTQVIIITLTLSAAWYLNKLRHPATVVTVLANIVPFFMAPIAQSPAVEAFLRAVFKG